MSRKAVRIALFVALVASALTSFLWGSRLWDAARTGSLPLWVALLAPILFSGFVVVYALDRWVQFRRDQHRLGWVLLQIGGAVAFLSLLWPGQAEQLRKARAHVQEVQAVDDAAQRLLYHYDADARATACEVLGLRASVANDDTRGPRVVSSAVRGIIGKLAQEDPNANVRSSCDRALGKLPPLK